MRPPEQLKEFRFVLVKANSKEAFETGLPSYAWDDPRLNDWFPEKGNYGVLAGNKHIIIDTDTPELTELVDRTLPKTFTVKSPGHGGLHFYYQCETLPDTKTIPIRDRTRPVAEQNIGHVRIGNGYVVGPGSRHPNAQLYLMERQPLATISLDQVREMLAPWLVERAAKSDDTAGYKATGGDLDFSITTILPNLPQLRHHGDHLQGPHPVHGSSTGTNFNVNTRDNSWYCFRCMNGGYSIHLLAVLERIVECENATPLRGEDFNRTLKVAVERGLVKKARKKKEEPKEPEEPKEYPWASTGPAIPCLDAAALFQSLEECLKRYVDFREPSYYPVVAAWIMHTWLIEDWRVSGPLVGWGPINSGKTTLGEIVEYTAYRLIRGGSMSNATMFRLAHAYTPSFFLDEADVFNREEWAETRAFLNERYKKGGKVWRMVGEGKAMVPQFFNCFGATYWAAQSEPWPAYISRGLILQMGKNTRHVDPTLTPEFEGETARFRQLLAGYREAYLGKDHGEYSELLKVKDYRTREIGYALMACSPLESRETILGYLQRLEIQHQAEEETSELADYVRALVECGEHDDGDKVTGLEVREKLAEILGAVEFRVAKGTLGEEPVRVVNWALVPKPRTVMGALSTLGFHKTMQPTSKRAAILWNTTLLTSLKKRYGVGVEHPPDPPDPPV